MSKAEPTAEELLNAYGFDLLLLDRIVQSNLIDMVEGQPDRWAQVYKDRYTELYQRTQE